MGVVNTTYTFTSTDTITSAKMNNIIDETTFTSDAIQGTTLQVVSPGKLAVSAGGITSNELATDSVVTSKILNGAVTSDKLNAAVIFVPSGGIMAFAMNSAPSGWLAANGSAVSRTLYAALFSAIGTTYGAGDGSTTFALPNLEGIFVRGSGSQVISGGTFAGTFAQKQAHMFQDHGHAGYTDGQGFHSHGQSLGTLYGNTSGVTSAGFANGNLYQPVNSQAGRNTDGAGTHSHNIQTYGANSGTTGGETRPANIALLYCIKI
jgi:microcystin-dependent protein